MTLEEKYEETIKLIERLLRQYKRPCVLWSGGKDSMVLLHMIRSLMSEIGSQTSELGPPTSDLCPPVVCWREPWMPHKQKFANRIIAEWNLTAWDWHPQFVALAKGNGRIDILNHYGFGAGTIILARGTERPHPGEPWLCARDTFLSRPTGLFRPPWDLAFHGHKSSDKDLLSGAVPLELDLLDRPGMTACAFPLRHWTDEEIWDYTEENNVPYDTERYRRNRDGTWEILPYQENNPDFYPTCVKCLDPDQGEFVDCPKLGSQIQNVSQYVLWAKPRLSYCNLNTEKEELKSAV